MTKGISFCPVEVQTMFFEKMSDIDVLRAGRVCRLWRDISQRFCEKFYQKSGSPIGWRCKIFPTHRALYSYLKAICLHRLAAWKNPSAHPRIHVGIRLHEWASVGFQEVTQRGYLVYTSASARLVTLPLVTQRDLSELGLPSTVEEFHFSPQMEKIYHAVQGPDLDTFYALNEHGSVFEITSGREGLKSSRLVTIPTTSSLGYDQGVIILGTRIGRLIFRRENGPTSFLRLGKGHINWLKTCQTKAGSAIMLSHDGELVFISNYLTAPQIRRTNSNLKAYPFIHGNYLIWESLEGFKVMEISSPDALLSFSHWSYATSVGHDRLLVQEKSGKCQLFDDQMRPRLLGSLPIVDAAFFQDDYLLTAASAKLTLFKCENGSLHELYRYDNLLISQGEKIIQVHFSDDGSVTYSTNHGQFFFAYPEFDGLPLPKIPELPGDQFSPNRYPWTPPIFACFEESVERRKRLRVH